MELDRRLKIMSLPNDGIGIMNLCCLVDLGENNTRNQVLRLNRWLKFGESGLCHHILLEKP